MIINLDNERLPQALAAMEYLSNKGKINVKLEDGFFVIYDSYTKKIINCLEYLNE